MGASQWFHHHGPILRPARTPRTSPANRHNVVGTLFMGVLQLLLNGQNIAYLQLPVPEHRRLELVGLQARFGNEHAYDFGSRGLNIIGKSGETVQAVVYGQWQRHRSRLATRLPQALVKREFNNAVARGHESSVNKLSRLSK